MRKSIILLLAFFLYNQGLTQISDFEYIKNYHVKLLTSNDSLILSHKKNSMQILFSSGFEDRYNIYVNEVLMEKDIEIKKNDLLGFSHSILISIENIKDSTFNLSVKSQTKSYNFIISKQPSCLITLINENLVKLDYYNNFVSIW